MYIDTVHRYNIQGYSILLSGTLKFLPDLVAASSSLTGIVGGVPVHLRRL